MADSTPIDAAAHRAECARRNGARSRGPASERGKARSSRNALRHGLTAQVHLVLDRDDEAGFAALAGGLEGELAPCGPLEGFLVARLTAAMWHTGRSERMEARAFQSGPDPDRSRLSLALRYRGSAQRELFRCLRALQELRRNPLAASAEAEETRSDAPAAAEEMLSGAPSGSHAAQAAGSPADLARIAVAAWGGERAGLVPPGFLELRPVPNVWPIAWRFTQDRAYPGDVPLLVYADGTVRSPDGELLDDVWSPGELPPVPPMDIPRMPRAGSASARMAPEPVDAAEPDSGPEWLDDDDDLDDDWALPTPRRRNEPSQAFDEERFQIEAALQSEVVDTPPEVRDDAPRRKLGSNLLDERSGPSASQRDEPERISEPTPPLPVEPSSSPGLGAWERLWGLTRPEPEPARRSATVLSLPTSGVMPTDALGETRSLDELVNGADPSAGVADAVAPPEPEPHPAYPSPLQEDEDGCSTLHDQDRLDEDEDYLAEETAFSRHAGHPRPLRRRLPARARWRKDRPMDNDA